jgi:2-keto-3-deoxy-L-rhamnonate aldolase RhmA
MGSPPPGAEGTPQPTEGLATNRERTDAQTAGVDCAGCHHGIINPTGYAMEAFDAIGAYQTVEKDTMAAINTAATVPMGDIDVDVLGPADLMKALAASPAAQRCYAKKWVQHAFERTINANDSCTVDTMAQKLTAGGYTIKALIADLTQSQTFRYRAVEVTP